MRTITTDRPVEAVYAYFLHPDEYVAPNAPDIESVERSPQGPRKRKVVPGAVVDSRIGPFLCPPHELRFEGVVGPLRPRCRFTFASVGEGTELRLEATPNPVGPLKVLAPFATRVGRGIWKERLARAKTVLESATRDR